MSHSRKQHFVSGEKNKKLSEIFIIIACVVIPVLIAWFFFPHQNLRYGKEPSVIYCNRGDTLNITFSSRDTGHSFFLQEFDIDAKVSPGNNQVLEFKASDPGTVGILKHIFCRHLPALSIVS